MYVLDAKMVLKHISLYIYIYIYIYSVISLYVNIYTLSQSKNCNQGKFLTFYR